jgi:microcystin-dependent protein
MNNKQFGVASLALVGAIAAGFSTPTAACSTEPYVGSLCVMAWTRSGSFGNGTYQPANGQTLAINTSTALYSLLGTTYGGNGSTTFQLPDLRGRTVIGAGQYTGPGGAAAYAVGQAGGTTAVTLTTAQMPAHIHTLGTATNRVTVTSTLGTMSAATALTGLTASTSMSGVTATAAGSSLTLNASSGGTSGTSPAGATLTGYTGAIRIYSDAAPTVAMKAGSISGDATVSFSGNPTTTINGAPTTTLSGAPAVTVAGNTDVTGGNSALGTMSPYLAMQYYIAAQGIYPTPD